MNQRIEFEKTLIASILNDPKHFGAVRFAFDYTFFVNEAHQKIVKAIFECQDRGYEITSINVANVAGLNGVGMAEIVDVAIQPHGNMQFLTKKLAEFKIMDSFKQLKAEINDDCDVFDLISKIANVDNEAQAIIGRNTRIDKNTLLNQYIEYLHTNRKDGVKRIPTGFTTLDRMLKGGLSLGDISFYGGLPGSGKTSFMLTLALNAARQGFKAAIIEGEMPANEVIERLNGISTGHEIDQIRTGERYRDYSEKFVTDLYDLPLELIPTYDRTVETLAARIQGAIYDGAQVVFVDYLQVYTPKGDMKNEFSQIKRISELLRKIALRDGVHIGVISSLNRNESGEKKLSLASFYGSSQLGHDCAQGFILSGEQNDTDELTVGKRELMLQVVKNRGGARGEIVLDFNLRNQQMLERIPYSPEPIDYSDRSF